MADVTTHHQNPRRWRRLAAALTIVVLAAAACGGGSGGSAERGAPDGADRLRLTVGYSPWPGWYPIAIADEEGFFEREGLEVEVKFFADYLSSLDAMAAGKLDINGQTLNDTIAAVAAGAEQVVVVIGDNSTGNDQIICDRSVGSIEDLKGKTIAAEAGVVDHFLLLQGLRSVGLGEDDIEFRGMLTADAAAAFAGGEFDCVGVYAPFTLQAMERPGAKVLFDSSDFPGTIPDLWVATRTLVERNPEAVQRFVRAWYRTLRWIERNRSVATERMAEVADLSIGDYEKLAEGTTIFTAEQSRRAFEEGDDTTSIRHTARLINDFLVDVGLTKRKARLEGLFAPRFTEAVVAEEPR